VETDPEEPAVSRLPGSRKAPYGPGSERAGLFPLFGAALLGAGLWGNARKLSLLARGRLARGSVTSRRGTWLPSRQGAGYRFTIRFRDQAGTPHQFAVRSGDVARFEKGKLPVIHDASAPSRAAIAAGLAPLLVDRGGGTLVPPPNGLLRAVLVPSLALLPHVAAPCWRRSRAATSRRSATT
jgi:hypothetical protein